LQGKELQVPFFNYQQAAGRLPHLWVGKEIRNDIIDGDAGKTP
jgi:hypothetical protein